MVVAGDLYHDFVSVADDYREKALAVLIVAGVGPLWLESSLKLNSEVHMAGNDKFAFRLGLPQLLLQPIELVSLLGTLFMETLVLEKVHDCI